jgi:hypothetical protein
MVGARIAVKINIRAVHVSSAREGQQQNENELKEFLHRLLKPTTPFASIAKQSKLKIIRSRAFYSGFFGNPGDFGNSDDPIFPYRLTFLSQFPQ